MVSQLRTKILLSALLCASLVAANGMLFERQAAAFVGSDFKAGRITDDAIFFSSPNISIAQIQQFLDTKVPVCDTNGTQPHGGTTRAAYAASNGVSTPFICLKDYRQNTPSRSAELGLCNGYPAGNHSAAEIIWRVGESCGVNPRALIVLLQKEQALVTDDWPWPIQYRSATGFGCPDTAPCDAEYYGFFNQVYAAARQFKRYARDSSSFNYRAGLNNNIQYNPNGACGSSSVFIQNQATAGLYNYTPYQPNAAALNNLYGTGDACSAYGNRNFWRLYYDWFGPPINDAYLWEVIQEPGVGRLYLVSNGTRHWIPGPAINTAWGLDAFPFREVSASYFNALHAGPNLSYVALDVDGQRYMMSSGKKHRLVTDDYVLLWGMAGVPHVFAPGLLTQVQSGGNASRFAATSTGGSVYLLNGTTKHLGVSAQSLGRWDYTADKLTVVTGDILDRFATGTAIDRYIAADGTNYVIDGKKALSSPNSALQHAWGNRTYVSIPRYAVNVMRKTASSNFVRADNDTEWYLLEDGKRHYVPSSAIARLWGWSDNNPLTVVSADMINQFTSSTTLNHFAYSTANNRYYLINGTKHWLENTNVRGSWIGAATVAGFSEQSLSLLPSGSTIDTIALGFSGSPHIFAIDNGILRHIPNAETLDAIGVHRNNPVFVASSLLNGTMPLGSALDYVVKDGSANGYYMENGYRFALTSAARGGWRATTAPTVSNIFLANMEDSGKTLGLSFTYNHQKFLMNDRTLLNVNGSYEQYGLTAADFSTVLGRSYMQRLHDSHLVGLQGSPKIWLLANSKRYYIPSFSVLTDLGYGAHSHIAVLDADIAALAPEDAGTAGRVLKASTTGAIFALNGRGLGFQDSANLGAFKGTAPIMTIPEQAFHKFGFSGWATRIIFGTDGKIYYLDSGNKRWITSPSLLFNTYGGIPWLGMRQGSVDAFTTGSPLQ